MLKDKNVNIKWNNSNKKRLIDNGYTFAKMGEYVLVGIDMLSPNSTVLLDIICDYCDKDFEKQYRYWIKGRRYVEKDSCFDCRNDKQRDVMLHKHGVDNPSKVTEFSEKRAKKRRNSIDKVRKLFEESGYKLVSDEYLNTRQKLEYVCLRHPSLTQETSYDNIYNNKTVCRFCRSENGWKELRLSDEEVINIFKEGGYPLYNPDNIGYRNTSTMLRVTCPKHPNEEVYSSVDRIRAGGGCPLCGVEDRSGENHYAWVGGPDVTGNRMSSDYVEWMKSVYERYDYQCQKCESVGNNLNAHHILNYSSHKEHRYDIDNGIVFCNKCHTSFHRRYGYRNNTPEQLAEFLNKEIIVKEHKEE